MATIPILNVPTYTPNQSVDFGGLGDLANSYRAAEAAKLKQQQDAQAAALAQQGYGAMTGQPQQPQAAPAPGGGMGFLSSLQQMFGGGQQPQPQPQAQPPATMPQPQAQPVQPQASSALPPAVANANALAAPPPQATPQADPLATYGRATSAQESGSPEGNYRAVGRQTNTGDRAYGRFQVMGANIPDWTEKYYGQRLTPREFLLNKDAQDAVYNGEFGRLVDKYGPTGAAKAWFAGERGMNNPNARDINGMTVARYGDQFNRALGLPPSARSAYASGDDDEGDAPAAARAINAFASTAAPAAPAGPPTASVPRGTLAGQSPTYGQNDQGLPTWANPQQPTNLMQDQPSPAVRAAQARAPDEATAPPAARAVSRLSPELFGALYANPNTRPMAAAILTQAMTPKDTQVVQQGGKIYEYNKTTGGLRLLSDADGARPATPEERQAWGNGIIGFDSDGKPIQPKGPLVQMSGPKGETAFQQAQGKQLGDFSAKTIEAAIKSRNQKDNLDIAERAMSTPGFVSGAAEPIVNSVRSVLTALGVATPEEVEALGATDLFKKVQNKAIMDSGGSASGLGPQISNADANIIAGSSFNTKNSVEGNRKIIAYMRLMEDRKVDYAREMNRYIHQVKTRGEDPEYGDVTSHMSDWVNNPKNGLDFSKVPGFGDADRLYVSSGAPRAAVDAARQDQLRAPSPAKAKWVLDNAQSKLTAGYPKADVYKWIKLYKLEDSQIPDKFKP